MSNDTKDMMVDMIEAMPDDFDGIASPRLIMDMKVLLRALSAEELLDIAGFMLASMSLGARAVHPDVSASQVMAHVLKESQDAQRRVPRLVK